MNSKLKKIEFKQINKVSLLKRVETKYLMSINKLNNLLQKLEQDYFLVIDNKNSISQLYSTEYYDTDDFRLYRDHHNGYLNRYKVRKRSYLDSETSYAEIKSKSNKKISSKMRIKILSDESELNFFSKKSPIPFSEMKTKVTVDYKRITLVDKGFTHRVTIDTHLFFKNEYDEITADNLVIIEIKKERSSGITNIESILKKIRVYPYRISKYCLGVIALYQNIKMNLFKKKIHYIEKLLGTDLFTSLEKRKLA